MATECPINKMSLDRQLFIETTTRLALTKFSSPVEVLDWVVNKKRIFNRELAELVGCLPSTISAFRNYSIQSCSALTSWLTKVKTVTAPVRRPKTQLGLVFVSLKEKKHDPPINEMTPLLQSESKLLSVGVYFLYTSSFTLSDLMEIVVNEKVFTAVKRVADISHCTFKDYKVNSSTKWVEFLARSNFDSAKDTLMLHLEVINVMASSETKASLR